MKTIERVKKDFEAEYSSKIPEMHSCYVSNLRTIKENRTGVFSLKQKENLEEKCILVLLSEIPEWRNEMPPTFYSGYRIFYKVAKLKGLMQLF